MNNLKTKTLLYAEDEPAVQTQYGTYFKNIFQEVYLAQDGQKALILFKEKKPDGVILDINMPQISGIELTKKIKKIAPKTPVILLTSRSDKETLKEAIELQLLTYLEKPVKRDDIKNALEKLSKKLHDKDLIKLWKNLTNFNYTWNIKNKTLYSNSEQIKLTKKETLLLTLFIEKKSVCTYQDIYEYVWQDDDKEYNESTIKTLLSTLKLKLPKNAIKNRYGMGYYINI
ncbi:MAG: response regulator [Campylobacterales bacterium]|nr:response regulator [Campylobacterales bacterium]